MDEDKATSFRLNILCDLLKETETQLAGVKLVKNPPEH